MEDTNVRKSRCCARYTSEEAKAIISNKNMKLSGVICRINQKRNLGVIYRPYKGFRREVLFHIDSDTVSKTNFSKARVGSKVEFNLYEDGYGYVMANNVKVIGHRYDYRKYERISLPNGSEISCFSVARYGIHNYFQAVVRGSGRPESEFYDNGYTKDMFDAVYIKCVDGEEYRLFEESSPVEGDGHIQSITEYLKFLDYVLVGIPLDSMDRNPFEVKTVKEFVLYVGGVRYQSGEELPDFYYVSSDGPKEHLIGYTLVSIESNKVTIMKDGISRVLDTHKLR